MARLSWAFSILLHAGLQQGGARPRLLREDVLPLSHNDRFLEVILDPGDVLENGCGWMPKRQVNMDLAHVTCVRRHRKTIRECEIRDLDVLGDPAEAGHIRLHVLNGPSRHKALERVERIELLS